MVYASLVTLVLMQVQRVHFPKIINDNEETYIRYLEGIICSSDIEASVQLTRRNIGESNGLIVRIAPSDPARFNMILDEMKKFHRMLNIEVEFSKSMKSGSNICFQINF